MKQLPTSGGRQLLQAVNWHGILMNKDDRFCVLAFLCERACACVIERNRSGRRRWTVSDLCWSFCGLVNVKWYAVNEVWTHPSYLFTFYFLSAKCANKLFRRGKKVILHVIEIVISHRCRPVVTIFKYPSICFQRNIIIAVNVRHRTRKTRTHSIHFNKLYSLNTVK